MSDQAQNGSMLKIMDTEPRQLLTVLAPVSELDEEEDVKADRIPDWRLNDQGCASYM